MDLRLESYQINVKDYQKAAKWYSRVLGLRLINVDVNNKYVVMMLGESRVIIETPTSKWGLGWEKSEIGKRMPFILTTSNLDKTIAELKTMKVKIVEEPSMRSWGAKKAVIADPDANQINIEER